uniref:Uncharacterized protein n=1 Tax=Trichogramma kaykai TaxID=54128 RepID=A0ABD2XFR6_9HYME
MHKIFIKEELDIPEQATDNYNFNNYTIPQQEECSGEQQQLQTFNQELSIRHVGSFFYASGNENEVFIKVKNDKNLLDKIVELIHENQKKELPVISKRKNTAKRSTKFKNPKIIDSIEENSIQISKQIIKLTAEGKNLYCIYCK